MACILSNEWCTSTTTGRWHEWDWPSISIVVRESEKQLRDRISLEIGKLSPPIPPRKMKPVRAVPPRAELRHAAFARGLR